MKKLLATISLSALTFLAASSAFSLDLGRLDNARVSFMQNGITIHNGKVVVNSINRAGVAELTIKVRAANRPYHCDFKAVSSGRIVSGKVDNCRFADNGQRNPTTCNTFLEGRRNGVLAGDHYCDHAPWIYTLRIDTN